MVFILAITGLIGAGKDVVAEHLAKKHGFEILQVADILRAMARERGLGTDRDTLQQLRKEYGKTFLAEEAVKRIKQSTSKKIVYIPLRVWEDYTIPKKEFGNKLKFMYVDATPQVRFAHLKARKRDIDPQTQEEFDRQEQKELSLYDFEKLFAASDYTLTNNGSFEELYKKLDTLMEQMK